MSTHSAPAASQLTEKVAAARFDGSFIPSNRPPPVSDGAPWYRTRAYYLEGWLALSIWQSAFIEAVGTMCLVYISGQITATLLSYQIHQLGAYIGISNTFLVSLFIYATSPASGGHLNPLITFSTVLAGICPLARGVLYLIAQTIGSALAGGLLIGAWGSERAERNFGGGCFFDPTQIADGKVFLNEFVSSFIILYLSYGVGLDPRQAMFFGPRFGPLLVGLSLGLVTFATSGVAPGYAGAQMNPARCFAYAIARQDFSDQWIWWFGPAAASVLLALIYNAVPPHHRSKSRTDFEETPRVV